MKDRDFDNNSFALSGRANYVDIKYTEKGTIYTRVLLSKKNVNLDSYDSYAVTFFGKTAEDFADKINKSDFVHIEGFLSDNAYRKDGKETHKTELIGKEFFKIKFDETLKRYVKADEVQEYPNFDEVDIQF